MKYPTFLKRNDNLGITALSSGTGADIKEVKIAINHLKEYFHLTITPNVYGSSIVSSDIETRINELNNLLDDDIKLLMNIRGGDFLYEALPYIDFMKIKNKNIWVEGYSDITSLLYILTTKYDLATIYGFNGKSFDTNELDYYQLNNFKILMGNITTQKSSSDRNTKSLNGDFASRGLIIGGCLDILRFIPGTEFDNTMNFIEKYRKQKIIWYFDIFAMGSVDVYLTLLQFKNMGWFKYSDTIIIGNILFPKVECELEYSDAFKKVFKDMNIVVDANIGHVKPVFTIINGSIANVKYFESVSHELA